MSLRVRPRSPTVGLLFPSGSATADPAGVHGVGRPGARDGARAIWEFSQMRPFGGPKLRNKMVVYSTLPSNLPIRPRRPLPDALHICKFLQIRPRTSSHRLARRDDLHHEHRRDRTASRGRVHIRERTAGGTCNDIITTGAASAASKVSDGTLARAWKRLAAWLLMPWRWRASA